MTGGYVHRTAEAITRRRPPKVELDITQEEGK